MAYYRVMIYIGADHRGFELKESLKEYLSQNGIDFEDVGAQSLDPADDYVDYAKAVSEAVVKDPNNKGILICGSGVGVDMVANKISGIRCSLVFDKQRAVQSREHEDANVLALPSDIVDTEQSIDIVNAFIQTPFSNEERHIRRLQKMSQLER